MKQNRYKVVACGSICLIVILTLTALIWLHTKPQVKGNFDYLKNDVGSLGGWNSNRTYIYDYLPRAAYLCLKENEIDRPYTAAEMSSLLSGNNRTHYNYLKFEMKGEPAIQLAIMSDGVIAYTFSEDKNSPKNSFRCYFDGKIVYIADTRDLENPVRIDFKTGQNLSGWSSAIMSTFK